MDNDTMIKVTSILLLILSLTSCASVPKPLDDMYHVGDGWIVAAYDKTHRVHVHARQLAPISYAPDATYTQVMLDHWQVRLVNSGTDQVCASVEFMNIDYYVDVRHGWYLLDSAATLYIGTLTQQPWELARRLFAFDDAKWVVNRLNIISTKDGKCDI
jgi:hypothetical protein